MPLDTPLQYGYTPDGPQGAYLAGGEDTYIKAVRDFQLQQQAQKQQADIQYQQEGRRLMGAQIQAQLENMKYTQGLREAQAQAKDVQSQGLIAEQNYPVISALGQQANQFNQAATSGSPFNSAGLGQQAAAYNAIEESLPPSVRAYMGEKKTYDINGQKIESSYDPEKFALYAQNAARSKGQYSADSWAGRNQASLDKTAMQGQNSKDVQQMIQEGMDRRAKWANDAKEAITSAKNSKDSNKLSNIVGGLTNQIAQLQQQLATETDPNKRQMLTDDLNIVSQHRQDAVAASQAIAPAGVINTVTPEGNITQTPNRAQVPAPTPTPMSPKGGALTEAQRQAINQKYGIK